MESVPGYHYLDPGDWTQVLRFGDKDLLRHLTGAKPSESPL